MITTLDGGILYIYPAILHPQSEVQYSTRPYVATFVERGSSRETPPYDTRLYSTLVLRSG